MTQALNVIILAAGAGKRMKSVLPKVLQPIAGRRIGWNFACQAG